MQFGDDVYDTCNSTGRAIVALDHEEKPIRLNLAKTCEDGDAQGCFDHGRMLFLGENGPKDYAAARISYDKACNGGIWVGCKSYAQVPFQFSNHIERADGTVQHTEFLDVSGDDPRRACAEALVEILCTGDDANGSVIAYYANFERSVIKNLAKDFDDLRPALLDSADRLVDLLPVTRNNYYHRDQLGSWSIKAVLPTVCPELDYSNLEVKAGTDAQAAYMEAISPIVDARRKAAVDDALREYCKRDTLAMVELLRALTAE